MTGFAVPLAMPLKMNGHVPPEMTGRSHQEILKFPILPDSKMYYGIAHLTMA